MKTICRLLLMQTILILFTACATDTPHSHKELSSQQQQIAARCEKHYHAARKAQLGEQYPQAIQSYRQCLATDTPDTAAANHLRPIIAEAMLQMMNCYQAAGKPEECVQTFARLHTNPTNLIRNYCLRDLLSIEAYALSRTERMEQAEKQIAQVLTLPTAQATHEQLFRDYAYAAAIYYPNPARSEQVIKLCQRCLQEASHCKHTTGAGWVQSMLGNLYVKTGKVNEAIELYEDCITRAEAQADTLAAICARTDLAQLYFDWNLHDQASQTLGEALILLHKKHYSPLVAVRPLLLKARISQLRHPLDTALAYIHQVRRIAHHLPYNSGTSDCDYLQGSILAQSTTPHTAHTGISLLQKAARGGTPQIKAQAYYQLARYEKRRGNNPACNIMLDSMYAATHQPDSTLRIPHAANFALTHYLQLHDTSKIKQYATALARETAKANPAATQSRLVCNIVNMRTQQKAHTLRLQQSKMQLRQTLWAIITILLLILLLLLLAWRHIRQQRLLTEKLNALMDRLEKSEANRTTLRQTLLQLRAADTSADTNATTTPALPNAESWITPAANVATLQQRFAALHPHFFPHLRTAAANITPADERLAMLILLGLNPTQIATIMQVAPRTPPSTATAYVRNSTFLPTPHSKKNSKNSPATPYPTPTSLRRDEKRGCALSPSETRAQPRALQSNLTATFAKSRELGILSGNISFTFSSYSASQHSPSNLSLYSACFRLVEKPLKYFYCAYLHKLYHPIFGGLIFHMPEPT